jgi:hypothetical protein
VRPSQNNGVEEVDEDAADKEEDLDASTAAIQALRRADGSAGIGEEEDEYGGSEAICWRRAATGTT